MSKRIPLMILTLLIAVAGIGLNTDGATGTGAGFSPSAVTVQTGQTFYLTVVVNDVNDLYGCQCDIEYNTEYLEMIDAVAGDFLGSDGADTYFAAPEIEPGKIQHGALTRLSRDEGIAGSGVIFHLSFRALKETSGKMVSLKNIQLVDRNARDIDKDYLNSGRCRITIDDEAALYIQSELVP